MFGFDGRVNLVSYLTRESWVYSNFLCTFESPLFKGEYFQKASSDPPAKIKKQTLNINLFTFILLVYIKTCVFACLIIRFPFEFLAFRHYYLFHINYFRTIKIFSKFLISFWIAITIIFLENILFNFFLIWWQFVIKLK